MIIYQVKVTVDQVIETAWLEWMQTKHVPDVIATGLIASFQILKASNEASTYYFHYHFGDQSRYEEYQKRFASELKQHPQQKFPNQFTAERSLLEWI